jgi:hypothetical protein
MAQCPLLAHSGHPLVHRTCPLLGVKQTCRFATQMSAFDPMQLLQRHAFLRQFLFCFLVLGQVRQAHAT